MGPDQEPIIRRATDRDLTQLHDLEALAFPSPWSLKSLQQELRNSQAYLWVLHQRNDEDFLAYIDYWVVAGELHLLKIATHPAHVRQGHGRRLMDHMLAAGEEISASQATLEVRPDNEAAIALYHRYGFREVGRRRAYYPNGDDALVLGLLL
jgi:[ribosomal protein S18]-alanine N-acetyltransferase